MTRETGKAVPRRLQDKRFTTRWFVDNGIDIGAGDDSLERYKHLFPNITSVKSYDKGDGDAKDMQDIGDNTYDFVYSSHCLEHLTEPLWAMHNWRRICKPRGYLIIVIPDYALYEHSQWPSVHNPDHKWCFSINGASRHNKHIVLLRRDPDLFDGLYILKIELLDHNYVYDGSLSDQSLNPDCEPAIEIVAQKL